MTPSIENVIPLLVDLGLADAVRAAMRQPVWLLISVILGSTLAVLARRHILGVLFGYCCPAAFGLIFLLGRPLVVPDDGGSAGWIAAALTICAGSAIALRLLRRAETI